LAGAKIYKTETRGSAYHTASNAFPPALGGWLIVLIIMLFGNGLACMNSLIINDCFLLTRRNEYLTGLSSTYNRISVMLKTIEYTSVICYAAFCLLLMYKKRDIAPRFIKGFYLLIVIFATTGCLFDAFINGQLSTLKVEYVIKDITVAVLWTYYLNKSTRVKETFVVPFPD